MIIDTGLTEQNLLDAVLAEVDKLVDDDPREPGEFTCQEFADHRGLTPDAANNKLTALVKAGKLTRRFANVGGRRLLYKIK